MKKRLERLKFFHKLFYLFSSFLIIFIQILFQFNGVVNTNVIGTFIFINSYLVAFYIIYNVVFESFLNRNISKISKINLVNKYVIFLLVNILIVNKIELNYIYLFLVIVTVSIAIYDHVCFKKLCIKVDKMIKENNIDIIIEQKEHLLKAWENSKAYKNIQLNVFNFIISGVFVYLTSFFTDFTDWRNIVICLLLFSNSLLLGFRYCFVLSKYIHIKWFEYLYFELFYGLVLFLLYMEMNLFIFIAIVPLIPIMKKENKVRKNILVENVNKEDIK